MNKQELVHFHGFLDELKKHYERSISENIHLEDYDELGVKSSSIHKSKQDHKNATLKLAEGLSKEMDKPGSASYNIQESFEHLLESANRLGVDTGRHYVLDKTHVGLSRIQLEKVEESDYGASYHRPTGTIAVKKFSDVGEMLEAEEV